MRTAKRATTKARKTTSGKTSGKAATGAKVQGEGDYESARKYNERTRAFVKRMASGQVQAPRDTVSQSELKAAEKKALARSKGRAGDRADARAMTAKVAAGSRDKSRRG